MRNYQQCVVQGQERRCPKWWIYCSGIFLSVDRPYPLSGLERRLSSACKIRRKRCAYWLYHLCGYNSALLYSNICYCRFRYQRFQSLFLISAKLSCENSGNLPSSDYRSCFVPTANRAPADLLVHRSAMLFLRSNYLRIDLRRLSLRLRSSAAMRAA